MTNSQALHILKRLVQGMHPERNEALPLDSVVNEPPVIRALLSAVDALQAQGNRMARRAAMPSQVGKPWTVEEEQALARRFSGGESVEAIAQAHQRTARAVEARLQRLGLLKTEEGASLTPFR